MILQRSERGPFEPDEEEMRKEKENKSKQTKGEDNLFLIKDWKYLFSFKDPGVL